MLSLTPGKPLAAALLLLTGLCFWGLLADDTVPRSLAATVSPSGAAGKAQSAVMVDGDLIRVGISDDAMTAYEYPKMVLSATGAFQVVQKSTGKVLLPIPANQVLRVTRTSKGFFLDHIHDHLGPLPGELMVQVLEPATQRLRIPSVTRRGLIPSYRGYFELIPGYSSADKFTVVNVLPLQDYLKAVVPNELPFHYGYEAVKAQAVAARNYAIRPREKPWPQFDICDSQYCQAYYGANTEHPQTSQALVDTQGLVALYEGEPILALYSSSHGGVAERYENAFSDNGTNQFPGTPLPYLSGGADKDTLTQDLSTEAGARTYYSARPTDNFDQLSPNYRWQRNWNRTSLEIILNQTLAEASTDKQTRAFVHPSFAAGGTVGTLKAIRVTRRGISGKAMTVEIESTNGTWTLQKEFVIRKVLQQAGKFLPSANVVFDMVKDKNGNILTVKAFGGGFGHGVGMSQLGASYMSKNGSNYVQILQHYYKGVALGAIPVTAQAGQGMKVHFFAEAPQGTLRVRGPAGRAVRVRLNQKDLSLTPNTSGKAELNVSSGLVAHQLNALEILPLPAGTEGNAKAWVEQVPVVVSAEKP